MLDIIFSSPILSQLQGWRLCQKMQKNILQINLLSFCATIELKLSKLWKFIKIEEKVIKFFCFLLIFWNKFFQDFPTIAPPGDFFMFPKMNPKINIFDLRLLEGSLSSAVFTIIKFASCYIIFWWKCGKSKRKICNSLYLRMQPENLRI